MNLLPEANADHVNEAIRLFKVSTLAAANSGGTGSAGGMGEPGVTDAAISAIQAAEEHLKSRLMVGSSLPVLQLVNELNRRGHGEEAVHRALQVMVRRGEMQLLSQGRMVTRLR